MALLRSVLCVGVLLGCGSASTTVVSPEKTSPIEEDSARSHERSAVADDDVWRELAAPEPVRFLSRPGQSPWFVSGYQPSFLFRLDPAQSDDARVELQGDYVQAGAFSKDGRFIYVSTFGLMTPHVAVLSRQRQTTPRKLPTESGGTVYDVLPLADGGALFAGLHNPTTRGESNGWVGRIDSSGKLVWDKRLGRAAYHFFRVLVPLGEGRYRALGGKENGETYAGWSVRVNENGDVDQERVYESRLSGGIVDGLATPSGSSYAIGVATEKKPVARGKGDAFIAVLDAQGLEVSRRDTKAALSNVVAVGSATVDEAGGLWFVAATQVGEPSPQSPEPQGQTWLVHLATEDSEFDLWPTDGKSVMLGSSTMAEFIVSATPKGATIVQLHKVGDGRLSWRMHHVGP